MIYGLLVIADPSDGIKPDYSKSAAQIYAEIIEASLWKQPITWNGPDNYLVSFSHLLQRVLGEPFWDGELLKCAPEACDNLGNLVMAGTIGKRISCRVSPSTLTELRIDEIEILPGKKQVWLEQSFSPSCENKPLKSRTIYRQKFNLTPYYCNCRQNNTLNSANLRTAAHDFMHKVPTSTVQQKKCHCWQHIGPTDIDKEQGSVLLLNPCVDGDFLCFFKDCDVAAVVRSNEQGTYSIVGHCVVDTLRPFFTCQRASRSLLEDWTIKSEVEMNREILQRLTM